MRKQPEEFLTGNLVAMIDVVFQLIIFFVCTVSMQDAAFDDTVRLAMAPHGAAITTKNPLEITVDVDKSGRILIARTPLSLNLLSSMLTKVRAEYGPNVPVIIRGDAKVKHEAVRAVMDACSKAGIWKISMAAYKERG